MVTNDKLIVGQIFVGREEKEAHICVPKKFMCVNSVAA